MIVFDTLFSVLIIYLFIYCIYQLFFFLKARDIETYFDIQEKTRSTVLNAKKLCVVIFATYKDKNLDKLLSTLNNQSYEKENYEVHVAYYVDNVDNSPVREYALGATIHNIQNPEYNSKDKAVNLVVEKLEQDEEKSFDAYIFLDASRSIGERYLENINKSIHENGAYIGTIVPVNEKNQLAKKIKNNILSAYLKYTNRTKYIARSMFNLSFFVDGGNVVVTKDVIEKLGYVGLENKTSQLEYSLELVTNDIKTFYCPYIISAVDIKNYDFSSVSIKDKVNLFIHYFPQLIFKSNAFREFILFLLRPNSLFVLLGLILVLYLSFYKPNHIAYGMVTLLTLFLVINFAISINVSRMTFKEILWLGLYPVCLFWQKLKIFINNLTMNSIRNSYYEEESVNSATISTVVNNGKKDFVSKLDLVSEDGMKKVIFREGNKFVTSSSCLRMYDALADMIYKLKNKGITLKTCQNCQNFITTPNGTLDCLHGKCKISDSEILIWNGCQYFYLKPENNNPMNLD